jgi:hypothetical protein
VRYFLRFRAPLAFRFLRLEKNVYLFRPFGGLYRRRELNPPAFHVSPRFAPILCRFRVFIAPTLARLLFGISIPTRHAVTFAALARVCVSNVSSLLFAFVLFSGGGLLAPRLRFSLRYYLRLSLAFIVCNPAVGSFREPRLVWGLVVRSLAPPCPRRLPLAVLLSRVSIVSNGGGYVSERRCKGSAIFGRTFGMFEKKCIFFVTC